MAKHSLLIAVAAFALGCGNSQTASIDKRDREETKQKSLNWLFPPAPYADFRWDPRKAGYTGELFKLSRDFPVDKPADVRSDVSKLTDAKLRGEVSALQSILAIPYDTGDEWLRYLVAMRDYCLEGASYQGKRIRLNPTRPWYHAPWLHEGSNGREGISGLTQERTAEAKQLDPKQTRKFDTFAIAYYNTYGGYTLGQVWPKGGKPEPGRAKFPVGTVTFKLLFSQATPDQVPFLDDPLEVEAYATNDPDPSTPKLPLEQAPRKKRDLRLLQMDVMIRDDRGTQPTTGKSGDRPGWVFGAFCYNGKLGKKNKCENLVPIGLSWGNDPQVINPYTNLEPSKAKPTFHNEELKQTKINSSTELPPQHLGRGGRLNGPFDNPLSSCISCHSTAQYPAAAPMYRDFDPGFEQTSNVQDWFRNIPCGEIFGTPGRPPGRLVSVDYSLQLALGLQNFDTVRLRDKLPGLARTDELMAMGEGNAQEVRKPIDPEMQRRSGRVSDEAKTLFDENEPTPVYSLNLAEVDK